MGSMGILCIWQQCKMQKSPVSEGSKVVIHIWVREVRGVNKTAPGREIVTKQMKREEMPEKRRQYCDLHKESGDTN